jgi:hypothetical protein
VWTLVRRPDAWELFDGVGEEVAASVSMDQDTAWKLFSKGLDRQSARQRIDFEGDVALGEPVLGSLAIMG